MYNWIFLPLLLTSQSPTNNESYRYSWFEVFDALAWKESNHGQNTTSERAKKENAVGWYQIRPIYVRDVNRILKLQGKKKRFKLEDRKSKHKSEQMIKILTTFYIKHYKLPLTVENVARIHNGGAKGWKKKSTLKYWQAVRDYLLKRK